MEFATADTATRLVDHELLEKFDGTLCLKAPEKKEAKAWH